ncbi:hypothetical protein WCN78_16005 [Xanthomonas axonopodis pv. vasculorum]
MDADLAASSTVMWEQDAAPFAGAADDFPAFNEEEIAWLMELFPQSSTVMWEQDAAPFAGAADDFPAFNEEEIAWLMELFPQ